MKRAWMVGAAVASLAAVAMAACSGGDENRTTTGPGGPGSGGAGIGGAGGDGGDLFGTGGSDGCMPGQACDEGGICAPDGMSCCEETLICGPGCCSDGEICSFEQCVAPGDTCIDATDCGPDEYCEYALGDNDGGQGGGGQGGAGQGGGTCMGGVELLEGKCLPKPPECGSNEDPGDPPTCLAKCEYIPDPGQFNPVEKFSWGDVAATNHDVMMAPIVTQLDDDNCDMKVDEKDIPDIVFFTFEGNDYNNNSGNSAALRAISIVGGQVVEKWTVDQTTDEPGRSIASGDIHPTYPGNEIVVCAENNRVRAYDAQGAVLWTSQPLSTSCFMPSIADLDQNGDVEVIVRGAVLDGETGAIEAAMSNTDNVVVSDVTGDNQLEIVGSSRIYDSNGQLMVDASADIAGTHSAVGDLDNDGMPEIVTVHFNTHTLSIWRVDPNAAGGYVVVRSGIDINGTISPNPCCAINPNSAGCSSGGGPPTIADFNGDGFPDVGLAGGIGYAVFDGVKLMDAATYPNDQTIAWLTQTQDCSSAQTGSSVFDFDGDGKAEVVYADEVTFHIYDGTTGTELFSTCNTSGTLWEYPLVADVDSDGNADIVIASNRYSSLSCGGVQKTTGIRIWGDTMGNWVRTRRIWNQHAYHVTNVEESGRIPMVEAQNYLEPGLNNFRQNVQPLGEFSAPDLVVEPFPVCGTGYAIVGRVRNIGEASVPPGVVVGFYAGDPTAGGTKLGEAVTTQTLYALGSEDVVFDPPGGKPDTVIYAVVDDGMPPHAWVECRTDNNTGGPVGPDCGAPL